MLKTEDGSAEMQARIRAAFESLETEHTCVTVAFEHGQNWVLCGLCGTSWSVVDVVDLKGNEGIDFEVIDAGDGSCVEALT